MFRNVVAMAIASAITTTPWAAYAVKPQPDNQGNFRNLNWPSWRVVDRDPNGLNCRQGPGTNHRIIRRFNFLIPITPVSSRSIKFDKDQDPWVEVNLENNQSCFVRSHSAYILPTWDFYQEN